jgi:hypothetical protein
MTGRKDLVALKMERALLQQQVQLMESQQARLAAILEKKRLRRQRQRQRQPKHAVGMQAGGRPLEKLPPLSPPPPLPAPPSQHKNIATQKPKPLLNNAVIQRFRREEVLRTKGREILERRSSPERKRKGKQHRRQKCLPSNKAPPCHFPDRYARNELPCSIEHGASGTKSSCHCPIAPLDGLVSLLVLAS